MPRQWPTKGRNAEVDFHGQKRSNETHASVTDPDARLYRKGEGKEAKLCYMGHALMENRNGLVVEACLTRADGHAERNAALSMIEPRADRAVRITLGADKDTMLEDFVNELKIHECNAACGGESQGLGHRWPHNAACRIRHKPAHPQTDRRAVRLEQDRGLAAKTMLRGLERVGGQFIFNLLARLFI